MIVENNIIFKDEDAGNAESSRFANDRNVAEQATVGARRVDPVRRDLRTISVERRKAAHRLNAVLFESAPHVMPTLQPSIEVDAHLVRKRLVDHPGGPTSCGLRRLVRVH